MKNFAWLVAGAIFGNAPAVFAVQAGLMARTPSGVSWNLAPYPAQAAQWEALQGLVDRYRGGGFEGFDLPFQSFRMDEGNLTALSFMNQRLPSGFYDNVRAALSAQAETEKPGELSERLINLAGEAQMAYLQSARALSDEIESMDPAQRGDAMAALSPFFAEAVKDVTARRERMANAARLAQDGAKELRPADSGEPAPAAWAYRWFSEPGRGRLEKFAAFKAGLPDFPEAMRETADSHWGHYYPGDSLDPSRFDLADGAKDASADPGRTKAALSAGYALGQAVLRTVRNKVKKIKVALFASYAFGQAVLESLLDRMKKSRDIEIVGVATDDLMDPQAKISLSARLWKNVPPERYPVYQNSIEYMALLHKLPVYTGQVKPIASKKSPNKVLFPSNLFIGHILPAWNPDVIIMSGFGQQIINAIAKFPRFGMYNLHPSSLAEDGGLSHPGADPYAVMRHEGLREMSVALHDVTEVIDGGKPVGFSSPASLIEESDGLYISVERFLETMMGPGSRQLANWVLDKIIKTRSRVLALP